MRRRLLRGLTPGEIRMASLLFGGAIDTNHWFMNEMVLLWQSAHHVPQPLVEMRYVMQYVSIFDAWSKQCEPR